MGDDIRGSPLAELVNQVFPYAFEHGEGEFYKALFVGWPGS